MSSSFVGKVALVTGAGRGIGRAIATRLHSHGSTVYGISKNKDNLDSLVKECPRVKPVNVSLSDWDATQRSIEGIGEMDFVVNCAGIFPKITPFLEIERSVFDDILSVNLMAPINISQIAGKLMKRSGKGGSIVNISSIASQRGGVGSAPYNISKAALDMVTKCMASELGPSIRVNSVNPSLVMTDMAQGVINDPSVSTGLMEAFKDKHPMARFGEINEVVDVVMFLLSEQSSYITGHCVLIDGGLFCRV